jgi:hypothetical protein
VLNITARNEFLSKSQDEINFILCSGKDDIKKCNNKEMTELMDKNGTTPKYNRVLPKDIKVENNKIKENVAIDKDTTSDDISNDYEGFRDLIDMIGVPSMISEDEESYNEYMASCIS